VNIRKHIPNLITALNIFSGSLAIVMAFEGNLVLSALLIGIASVFDFLDGMAARALKAYSEMGKELDSLADMLSFGFAPAAILYSLINTSLGIDGYSHFLSISEIVFISAPFLIAIFSGLRLAKFNVDTRQTSSFIGLPTPANAILIASLPVILHYSDIEIYKDIILNKYVLIGLILFQSYMLIAEFPMFSLKFKNLKFAENKIRFVFIGISIILLITLHIVSIPIIIFLYIILSAINNRILSPNK